MSEAKAKLQAAIDALGITYTADFVPFSKSRNAKKATKPGDYSLNWKVTIRKNGRSLCTDYMQGIGHIPGKAASAYRLSIAEFERIKSVCESGKYGREADSFLKHPLPLPDVCDVMHCLVLDAEVLEYARFEEWAENFGYEPDSRKAEQTYRDCMAIALQLRSIIGDAGIQAVREAGQDY